MTDNEIIKALECCKRSVGAILCTSNCPMYSECDSEDPMEDICGLAFDLINRQKAEIEELKADKIIAERHEKDARALLKQFVYKKSISEYPVKVMIGDNAEIHAKSTADYEKLIADISNISGKELTQAICRQFPTKVTHEATLHKCCTCPNCKNVVDKFEKFGDSIVRVKDKYCSICGQALDWSDE